ncbi:MAG: long-chain fatty acid--CoA ligase [Deltaproteobacteria bacterium]|nr:long-chain fatty acid--CoA ligase [Deltaproteobacteria bacterium]
MEERTWHKRYDKNVPPSLNYPAVPLFKFLDDTAAKFPDRVALSFLGKQINYRQLLNYSNSFARGLADLGLKKGDRVALFLPNVPHMVIAYYGVLKAGGVCVTTNPLYTERELSHQVKDSGATMLVTLDLDLTLSKVKALKKEIGLDKVIAGRVSDFLPFPKNLLYPLVKKKDLTPVPATSDYVRFRDLIGQSNPVPPAVQVEPDDLGVLMYTGGTTGVSKGAMLTHRNLVVNTIQTFAWATSGEMRDTPQESIMTVLPLYHSFAMTVCMNHGVRRGARIILFPTRPKPDLSDFLPVIRDEQPTMMPGVPTLYTTMANHPKVKEFKVDCIKVCNSGAAPLPVEVLQKFESVTGAKIIEGYGLSETTPVASCNPLTGERKVGSIGIPVSDTDFRLVDQDTGTKDVAAGEAGEVIIKGPQVMKGYWNRPDETKNSLRDGWLFTGDVAKMDEDGYFFIVDRKKDMIITGGFNIFPREVEEVLYEHPKVLEAAVIGVKDERSGERVKAFVVLKEGQNATSDEIVAFCKEKLTGYKVPKLVEFRKELPKTNIGKVLRRVLREEEEARGK